MSCVCMTPNNWPKNENLYFLYKSFSPVRIYDRPVLASQVCVGERKLAGNENTLVLPCKNTAASLDILQLLC